MAIEIQSTRDLLTVVENFPSVPSFWLDTFFGSSHFSNNEYIDFDLIDKGKRLAPFVVPNVQGQPMLQRRESIRSFKPAYLKPKDAVDPQRVLRRRPGEALGGDMTPAEREDAIIADILADHDEMIRRRWEWMACEAVVKGEVTVEGENYPTRIVQFGRAAANNVVLSGGAQWGESGGDPLANIKAWATQIMRAGRRAERLIMGLDASAAFFADAKIADMLETRRGSTARMERYNVSGSPTVYHGDLPGGIEVWTYNDVFEDNDGVEQPFLDPADVVLAGEVQGVRAFGAIMDRKADWAPLAMFPKMWEQDDPSGLFLMTQSAPLMVPLRPNASLRATVV